MRGGGITGGNPALNLVAGAVSEQNPDGGVGLIFALKGPRNAALYLSYDPVILACPDPLGKRRRHSDSGGVEVEGSPFSHSFPL